MLYRQKLLPPSETFVRDQVESMRRYEARYVGARRVPGLTLPVERMTVLRGDGPVGAIREFIFREFGYAPGLRRQLARFEASLIHAHFGPDAVCALPLARDLGLPLIVTFHGYDATTTDEAARVSHHLHRLYLRRRGRLQREGSLFLAVSRFVAGKLAAQGYDPDRVRVHYVGIDSDRFTPGQPGERRPVVLFVGRLVANKGCDFLLRAMARVVIGHPEVEVVVIGDGPEQGGLRRLAESLRLPVQFLGTQSVDVVRRWMRESTLLCAPSVTIANGQSEGFGLVLLEAQACETPVAGFATGGIPETLVDGQTGLLAPEGNETILAERISTLLGDPARRSQMGIEGRRWVRSRFDLRSQTDQLEDVYDEVVRGVANPPPAPRRSLEAVA